MDTAVKSVELGDLERAGHLAAHVADPVDRARLLHVQRPTGPDVAGRFTALADEVDYPGTRALVLAWAAEAATRWGDVEQAWRLLDQAEHLVDHDLGGAHGELEAIGVALVRAGDPEQAVQVVLARPRSRAWREVCTALVEAEQTALARTMLQVLEMRHWTEPNLRAELIGPLIAVGDVVRAEQIVGELRELLRTEADEVPTASLADIARNLFANRDPHDLPEVVDQVLARVRSDLGDVTGPIPGDFGYPLAAAMTRTDDLDGALRLVEDTDDREERAEMELAIAVTLLHRNRVDLATPLVARLLHPDNHFNWYHLVRAFGAHFPELTAGGADELTAHLRRT